MVMWSWKVAAEAAGRRSRRIGAAAAATAAVSTVAVFNNPQTFPLEDDDDYGDHHHFHHCCNDGVGYRSNITATSSGNYYLHLMFPGSYHRQQHSRCEAASMIMSPGSNPSSFTLPQQMQQQQQQQQEEQSQQQPRRVAKITHRPSNNISGGNNFCLTDWYDVEQVLGEGSFGLVYKARRKADGQFVAVKTMPRSLTGKTDFEREVAALQLLSKPPGHDNVVKFYDLHRDETNYYLVMELVEGGELLDSLINEGPYSEAVASSFVRQFAEALNYVHTQGYIHADLKPENLLLSSSNNQLKLADFGCAKSHDMSRKDMQLPAHEFAMVCKKISTDVDYWHNKRWVALTKHGYVFCFLGEVVVRL